MGRAAQAEAIARWVENQRALARALGLTIEEWLDALERAGRRSAGLTAAVVGAAMGQGLGLDVLQGLDGAALAVRARALIDPAPPRVENPLLREAIRRAAELGARPGTGARRLRAPGRRVELPTPAREARALGRSSDEATPDAAGTVAKPPSLKKKRRKRPSQLMDDEETTSGGARRR